MAAVSQSTALANYNVADLAKPIQDAVMAADLAYSTFERDIEGALKELALSRDEGVDVYFKRREVERLMWIAKQVCEQIDLVKDVYLSVADAAGRA